MLTTLLTTLRCPSLHDRGFVDSIEHLCRHSMDNKGGKKARQNVAQLVEVDIPGAGPPRAPVARDASIDELIGKSVK